MQYLILYISMSFNFRCQSASIIYANQDEWYISMSFNFRCQSASIIYVNQDECSI